MQARVDRKAELLEEEKQKRRAAVAREAEKRKAVEQTLDEVNDWVGELHLEIEMAKKESRAANKNSKASNNAKAKADSLSAERLALLKHLRAQMNDLRDELADESKQRVALERMQMIQLQIKRERPLGRGGGSRWPVHIILLICEMLVNGTPPTAIRKNIQTSSAAFTGKEAEVLPSVNFIRSCRVVLQNMNETLAALRLGKAESWHQLFTDGTSRRQIAFQNLVIALMEDGKLDPVIVSSCMVVEDETSENQVKSILETVSTVQCVLDMFTRYAIL